MKKRGFTLIELLAVIVILAIIALIATPIVMNVIENAKKGAAERSMDNYVDAVETAIIESRLDNIILEGEYVVQPDGNLCLVGKTCVPETEIKVDMNGNKPTSGRILIKNGKVYDGSTSIINNYVVNTIDGVSKIDDFGTVIENNDIIGQIVGTPTLTYNPITGEKGCTPNNTSCFGWYVLEDKGEDYAYVTLIMDRNLGKNVAWCSDEMLCKDEEGEWDHNKGPIIGPITPVNYLKEQTSDWSVVASLPTYDQIYNVNNSVSLSATEWLRDNLNNVHNSTSRGYYIGSNYPGANAGSCVVYYYEEKYEIYSDGHIDHDTIYGVRPVITISKTKLN